MIKYGIPILAVLTLVFAVVSVARMTPVRASVPPPEAPPSAVFDRQIGAVGLVEASSENIAICVPMPGLVVAVHVLAGEVVKKGQPLFSLDARDLRAELALRQSSLVLARVRLERVLAAPRPEDTVWHSCLNDSSDHRGDRCADSQLALGRCVCTWP